MSSKPTYAFTVYKYHSITEEDFTLYGLPIQKVKENINKCLSENKTFRVIVFDGKE